MIMREKSVFCLHFCVKSRIEKSALIDNIHRTFDLSYSDSYSQFNIIILRRLLHLGACVNFLVKIKTIIKANYN